MSRALTPVEVLTRCFGGMFAGETWRPWRCFVAALTGSTKGLTADDRALILRCTGRTVVPSTAAREAAAIVGRRGGKSRIAAALAVILACFRSYPQLAPGERGLVMVIAPDKKQARVIFNYVRALLRSEPFLEQLAENETKESIELTNGIAIEVVTSSFRSVRGFTAVAVLIDEVAFLPSDDSAEPDTELLNALRPAMSTIPDALLLMISSSYARRGELWKAYERHFGKDDAPVLVWKADSQTMNPSLAVSVVQDAYERDASAAAAEYGSEFRSDIEKFLSLEQVQGVTGEYTERRPGSETAYVAFVDPAGGSGGDSMTLAIGHREGETAIVDAIRETRPPFSPDATVGECAELLAQYGVDVVEGDRFAGEWPREAFRKAGVQYRLCDKTKSELYLALLPLLNSGRVTLPKSERLKTQLVGLERRTGRAGRDTVDHGPAGHDDLANAVAGVAHRLAIRASVSPLEFFQDLAQSGPVPSVDEIQAQHDLEQRERLEESARAVHDAVMSGDGVWWPR